MLLILGVKLPLIFHIAMALLYVIKHKSVIFTLISLRLAKFNYSRVLSSHIG